MNNNAYGTIAGLQKAHYGLTYGTTFPSTGRRADARLRRDRSGLRRRGRADPLGGGIQAGARKGDRLRQAVRHRRGDAEQSDADAGHWNILDIYSPGSKVGHVSTD